MYRGGEEENQDMEEDTTPGGTHEEQRTFLRMPHGEEGSDPEPHHWAFRLSWIGKHRNYFA